MVTFPTICGSVAANPSPLGVKLHNAGYAAAGLDFTYVARGTDDLKGMLQIARSMPYRGLGISMPYKQQVLALLDERTDAVDAIGACNTVVNDSGRLVGYNTDGSGAAAALREVCDLGSLGTATIIGAGGVARAIAYALRREGLDVYISARSETQRASLVQDLGLAGHCALDEQGALGSSLLVNATPDASLEGPLRLDQSKDASVLLDVVFQQRTTPLVASAEARGMAVARGWRMLLHQAMEQFALYTLIPAPEREMSAVLEAALPE